MNVQTPSNLFSFQSITLVVRVIFVLHEIYELIFSFFMKDTDFNIICPCHMLSMRILIEICSSNLKAVEPENTKQHYSDLPNFLKGAESETNLTHFHRVRYKN